MTNKEGARKMSERASWMKAHGVVRRTATCPICNRTISVPTDRHFYGKVC